jgi:hypothetical protein
VTAGAWLPSADEGVRSPERVGAVMIRYRQAQVLEGLTELLGRERNCHGSGHAKRDRVGSVTVA